VQANHKKTEHPCEGPGSKRNDDPPDTELCWISPEIGHGVRATNPAELAKILFGRASVPSISQLSQLARL
jgi:hypothetical protein